MHEITAQEEEYAFPYHYVAQFQNGHFRQHFVDTWGINYALTIEFILSRVRALRPGSVIDIGCGDGRLTRELSLGTGVGSITGVDFSARAIKLAQAMNADHPEITFLATDITQPHTCGPFDLGVLMEVFEHIPPADCEGFLAGVRRLLKPGSTLLLTVPHANNPLEYKHFQHFTSKSLLRYLETGFQIQEVMPFEKRAFSREFLEGLLCNRLFVLNEPRLLAAIYRFHRRRLFHCHSEDECQRLFVEARVV
ncbi:MAG TPA: methyltransferase domain-containing protein [Chromatiaceae bacterium]|jgi:2-polyprenyl-3-methyl-5-hydroxy-6-metoxy-1,4-benzoquinol methylase|nr:methyltransferase domain-containing protein [Chromatiaceae bacterium]